MLWSPFRSLSSSAPSLGLLKALKKHRHLQPALLLIKACRMEEGTFMNTRCNQGYLSASLPLCYLHQYLLLSGCRVPFLWYSGWPIEAQARLKAACLSGISACITDRTRQKQQGTSPKSPLSFIMAMDATVACMTKVSFPLFPHIGTDATFLRECMDMLDTIL